MTAWLDIVQRSRFSRHGTIRKCCLAVTTLASASFCHFLLQSPLPETSLLNEHLCFRF